MSIYKTTLTTENRYEGEFPPITIKSGQTKMEAISRLYFSVTGLLEALGFECRFEDGKPSTWIHPDDALRLDAARIPYYEQEWLERGICDVVLGIPNVAAEFRFQIVEEVIQ